MSKKNKSNNGLSNRELLEQLSFAISTAMEKLGTLESRHHALWMNELEKTPRQHLRTLLQEVTAEISSAQKCLNALDRKLQNMYQGICLH